MPTQRLKMISLTLVISVVVVFGAAAQRVPKGQVVVALGADVPALDPHMHNIRGMLIVGWQLFDNLISRDPTTMKPVPHLAESWRLVDELTWELKLRHGVKFHNGEPFNAATVKYNFERVLNPDQKSPQRGNIAWIARVDVVDDYTVRLITKAPQPIVPERLTNFQMVPAAYAKEVGDTGLANKPVGTGPYKFVSWTKGQQVVLEANTDYWQGPPAVKTVIFRIIPAMRRRSPSCWPAVSISSAPSPQSRSPVIEASGTAYVSMAPMLRVVYLGFDCLGRDPTSQPALQDKRVRQAIAHAIDVDGIIYHVLGGIAAGLPQGSRRCILATMAMPRDMPMTLRRPRRCWLKRVMPRACG